MNNFFDPYGQHSYDRALSCLSRSELSTRSEGGIMTEMMILKELVNKYFHKTFLFSDSFHLGNKVNIFHLPMKN